MNEDAGSAALLYTALEETLRDIEQIARKTQKLVDELDALKVDIQNILDRT